MAHLTLTDSQPDQGAENNSTSYRTQRLEGSREQARLLNYSNKLKGEQPGPGEVLTGIAVDGIRLVRVEEAQIRPADLDSNGYLDKDYLKKGIYYFN